VMLEDVMARADEFDIIHFHVDYLHFPMSRIANLSQVSTLHGRLDLRDLVPVYRKYSEMPLISISLAQRKPLCWANWVGNVYHGLSEESLALGDGGGKYLAFLGRISPEKRVDRAIQIATETGMPLKIAAKVDRADREYYASTIKPLLANPNVEYIGEITEDQKSEFLGNAYALLFPVAWPEPFGLVMIEAMACGTPTIAFRCGSVPEIIHPGVNGFIVDDVAEAVAAVAQVSTLNRSRCRADFEERFTASRMAQDYVRLYEAVIAARSGTEEAPAVDSLLTL
jgi:glycosyltransferase involved in cell wall biosynthesis